MPAERTPLAPTSFDMPDDDNRSLIDEGDSRGVGDQDLIGDIGRQWYAVFAVLAATGVAFVLWDWLCS